LCSAPTNARLAGRHQRQPAGSLLSLQVEILKRSMFDNGGGQLGSTRLPWPGPIAEMTRNRIGERCTMLARNEQNGSRQEGMMVQKGDPLDFLEDNVCRAFAADDLAVTSILPVPRQSVKARSASP
jgi:hypothetical protein